MGGVTHKKGICKADAFLWKGRLKWIFWMDGTVAEEPPTGLLAGGAGAPYERFAPGKTSAQGRLCRSEH